MLCGMALPATGKEAAEEKAGKVETKSPPAEATTTKDKKMMEMSEMLKMMEILREMEMMQDYHLIAGEETHEKEN
jgi:hypothetical protein